jgi:hypothetical protein
MKKTILILGILILAMAGLGVGGYFLLTRDKPEAETTEIPEQEGKLIETPLEERPYVTLVPRADGKEFKMTISRIQNAKTIEYEMVYLASGLSRGVVGSVKPKAGESRVTRDLLLGTCSRDVCKYDEGVTEGTLTLRFRSAEGVRKFTADFHLQQGDEVLTSKDDLLTLEGKIPSSTYYITMSTIGLPGEVKGEVLAGPYGVFSAGSQTLKNGQASLSLEGDAESATLYFWGGKAWEEVEDSELEEGALSASTTSLGTFVAVSPAASE